MTARSPGRRWLRRIGWMTLLWASSVAALALVAAIIRGIMSAAGLTAPR